MIACSSSYLVFTRHEAPQLTSWHCSPCIGALSRSRVPLGGAVICLARFGRVRPPWQLVAHHSSPRILGCGRHQLHPFSSCAFSLYRGSNHPVNRACLIDQCNHAELCNLALLSSLWAALRWND